MLFPDTKSDFQQTSFRLKNYCLDRKLRENVTYVYAITVLKISIKLFKKNLIFILLTLVRISNLSSKIGKQTILFEINAFLERLNWSISYSTSALKFCVSLCIQDCKLIQKFLCSQPTRFNSAALDWILQSICSAPFFVFSWLTG